MRLSLPSWLFAVEMCTCQGGVLGYGLTFYAIGCAHASRAFRFVDLDAYISHACFSFSGLTIWFVGFRLLRSCRMANEGTRGGVTPLAHLGIFSGACTELRKCPNELMAPLFPKACESNSLYIASANAGLVQNIVESYTYANEFSFFLYVLNTGSSATYIQICTFLG